MKKLFSEFKPVTAQDWKDRIVKDLKGADYSKLRWNNPNNFTVEPFYTKEDISDSEPLSGCADWNICEEILVTNDKSANAAALKALNSGAGGLLFILNSKPDLETLLKDISVQHIDLHFSLKKRMPEFAEQFNSWLVSNSIQPEHFFGNIFFDPIANLAESGNWFTTQEKDLSAENYSVDASLYQNAGATQSFELACTLAHGHEYVLKISEQAPHMHHEPFRIIVSVGSDFFGEIAKLRALQKLWGLMSSEYNANRQISIHCRSTMLNRSSEDPHTNMLRTTTEAMSAILGGCRSLTLCAYNSSEEKIANTAGRIARNQQLICKEESYLHLVNDPSAGSYYIEKLTEEIAKKAWEEFKLIEKKGGMIAALKSNYIQERIAEQARQLVTDFKEEKIILVGVNKYRKGDQNSVIKRQEVKRVSGEINPIPKLMLEDHFVKQHA